MGLTLAVLRHKKEKKQSVTQKQKKEHFANARLLARKSARKLERLAEAFNAAEAMTTQHFRMIRLNSLWVEQNGSSLEFSYYVRHEKRSFRATDLIGVGIIAKDLFIEGYLTERMCEDLTKFLSKANRGFVILKVGHICCSSEQLNRLVEASKAKTFICHVKVPREFFGLSSLKNIHELHVSSFLSDIEMLELKMPKMHLEKTNISSFGVHKLLKEWLTGRRDVISITIETEQDLYKDLIFDGIAHSDEESPASDEESYIIKKENQAMIVTLDEPFVFLRRTKI